MASDLTVGQFTSTDALSVLLTTESLMFAALSLTASLTNTGGRPRDWVVKPVYIAGSATAVLALVAVGAAVAWHQIFGWRWTPNLSTRGLIAFCIIAPIVLQPVLAGALTISLRKK